MSRALRPLVLVALLVVPFGLTSSRDAAAGTPTDQLRDRIDRVVGILDDGDLKANPAARRAALRGVTGEIFDFTEITRRALGRHWQTASAGQRDELVRLLSALMERSYMGRIEQYSGERIAFVSEVVDGDLATVRTHFLTRGGTPIPVDYRLARAGDRWLAYDVTIEGVSLVANFRAQFNKIIQTSSTQGLVERLRARQE
ncbi:MAG: organic solvent tolerance ABC transporter substrate-binding protein [Candidatus Rokuibacteriota bacterium]|nr:MAG: organic solvent tolerance ABC transporter substrate-binding protein [Candidatus Rokubacteria bacterium]